MSRSSTVPEACYVPWLHMHQPKLWVPENGDGEEKLIGNLEKMLRSGNDGENWEARLMARAYKNPAKYVKKLSREGYKPKIMLDFSGTLLEELDKLGRNGTLDRVSVDGEAVGNIINEYRDVLKTDSVEMVGTGHYHPYFPVTPEADWSLQIGKWREKYGELFGEEALQKVKGFWLPEMGVPQDREKQKRLIKTIKDAGYEWLILPYAAVEKNGRLKTYEEKVNQPFILKLDEVEIPVIIRDHYLGIRQQSGTTSGQVLEYVENAGRKYSQRKKGKPAFTVPTSDGENGNVMMNQFFPENYEPFFRQPSSVEAINVSEYLEKYGASEVLTEIDGGSWTFPNEHWAKLQKEIEALSGRFHSLPGSFREKKKIYREAEDAVLNAETSCYVYWNDTFWFGQGKKSIEYAHGKIDELAGRP